MALELGWWTVDVSDAEREADFYTSLLGWERLFTDETGIAVVPSLPPVLGQGLLLYTDHATPEKTVKNRAHLDLRPADQAAAVDLALGLGAGLADIGQVDVGWEVMADPEGNEFCLLTSGDGPPGSIVVDAWTLDVGDLDRAATFWGTLLDLDEVDRDDDSVRLRDPSGRAFDLLLLAVDDPKTVENRVHPDLFPDGAPEDVAAREREVERALALGASRVDIGQGDVPWAVLADPDGNEFCVLLRTPAL